MYFYIYIPLFFVIINFIKDEQHIKYTKELAIQCLRRLRIHAVSSNSEQIFQRARIKNWIKICTRLKRLDQGMHYYYNYRLKYSVLNQWIWKLRKRYQYGTKIKQEIYFKRDGAHTKVDCIYR